VQVSKKVEKFFADAVCNALLSVKREHWLQKETTWEHYRHEDILFCAYLVALNNIILL
jgi:hypothetical protein